MGHALGIRHAHLSDLRCWVLHQMLHHNRILSFAVHFDAAQQAAMQTTYNQVVAFMMWCDVCLIRDQLQAVLGSDDGDVDGHG